MPGQGGGACPRWVPMPEDGGGMGREVELRRADEEENSGESSSEEAEEAEEEDPKRWWERHRLLINLGIVFIYFVIGVVFVKRAERWGTLTSVYVIIQIITTIGYGDITVEQPSSEWFMIIYVFVGLMVCANIINEGIDRHLSNAAKAMRARLRRLEAYISRDIPDDEVAKERCGALNGVLVALSIYGLFILAGTLFYAYYEACSCSYGASHMEGCIKGDQCFATGGYRKNFRSALYMSVITLSTTGFGDYAPKTKVGRVFGIIWMPLGVLSWVNLITNVLFWWRALKQAAKHKSLKMTISDFTKLDANHDGSVSRAEFRVYFLLKEQIVKEEDIKHIDAFFEALDKDGSGSISEEELRYAAKLHRKIAYEY